MMKAAVLAAMTAIALSSTPLLRFSSGQGFSAHTAGGPAAHTAVLTHTGHAAENGLSASETLRSRETR